MQESWVLASAGSDASVSMLSSIRSTISGTFAYNAYEKKVLEHDGDSNLIKAHSHQIEVDFKGTKISVRAAIVPHQNVRKLGDVLDDLPLVFFIHGLGGQLNQFEYLIDGSSFVANTVAIDLPGHGQSSYSDDWDIYSTTSFVYICQGVLKNSLIPKHNKVILVGHSMGSIVAVRLAEAMGDECAGLTAITPPYNTPKDTEALSNRKKWLYYVPPFLFDILRASVRVGGLDSKSVKSLMSVSTSDEATLVRQLRVNLQSQTRTWLRTAYGIELLTEQVLNKLSVPTLVIGADHDKVCPNAELMSKQIPGCEYHLVHNAGHAILIEKPHVLSGLCGDFLARINPKMCQTWQLEYIASKSDKWSVKNETKWKGTQSVGEVVSGFRGMKTLRQDDPDHNPQALEDKYQDVVAVVDISREQPIYDPNSFKRIRYHKFPTVAKHPPSVEEVANFIKLVNTIRDQALEENPSSQPVVAVHCHYGFNRTGFLICSYLIQNNGWGVQEAVDAYAKSRPTGIHHAHFIDELHLRYNL